MHPAMIFQVVNQTLVIDAGRHFNVDVTIMEHLWSPKDYAEVHVQSIGTPERPAAALHPDDVHIGSRASTSIEANG